MQPPSRRGADRLEIRVMAPLARAIDVLNERALVALHHVPPPAAGDDRGRERQRQPARRRGQRRGGQRVLGGTGLRRPGPRAGALPVLAATRGRPPPPPRRALPPPPENTLARQDEESPGTEGVAA